MDGLGIELTHFRKILLDELALLGLVVGEGIAHDGGGHGDGHLSDGVGGTHVRALLLVLGAVLRLGDDVLGLGVSGCDDTRTLLFGVAASLENDLGSLATGLGDDGIGLIANLGRLGLGGVSLLEAVLDLVLTGIQNGNDLRPDELGQQEPDDQDCLLYTSPSPRDTR